MLGRLLLCTFVAALMLAAAQAFATPEKAYAEGYEPVEGVYYTDADIEAAIEANFDYYDWAIAKSVAWCESGYSPTAYNPALDTVGLFQISYIARVEYGLSVYDVDTPYENAYWADQIQDDLGWYPWACA